MSETPHIPLAPSGADHHIGAELRARRHELGHSQAYIAGKLNISADYIEALETLNTSALPAVGYVLGYVRAYAQLLGLPGNEAVTRYKTDLAVPENLGRRSQPHFVPKRRIRLPRGLVPALSVLSGMAMLTVWYARSAPVEAGPSPLVNALDAPSSAFGTLPEDPAILTLKATAPSWVQISDPTGHIVMSRIMVTGEVWAAPKDKTLLLSARDGGALSLYAGQTRLGVFGERGVAFGNVPFSAESLLSEVSPARAQIMEEYSDFSGAGPESLAESAAENTVPERR